MKEMVKKLCTVISLKIWKRSGNFDQQKMISDSIILSLRLASERFFTIPQS